MAEQLTMLEAVNLVLAGLQEEAVASVAQGGPLAERAQLLLTTSAESLMAEGWYFNTTSGLTLAPQPNGRILVPNKAIQVAVTSPPDLTVSERRYAGVRTLFRSDTHSLAFTSPITVQVTWLLAWDEMPRIVQDVAVAQAILDIILSSAAEEKLLEAADRRLRYARLRLEREEIEKAFEDRLGPLPRRSQRLLVPEVESILAEGWFFNTTKGLVLTPNDDGHIVLPSGVLHVDCTDPLLAPVAVRLVGTERRLINTTTGSFVFEKAITVKAVWSLVWGELPRAAQDAAVASASLALSASTGGSQASLAVAEKRLREARDRLKRYDLERIAQSGVSLLDGYSGVVVRPWGRLVV